MRYTYLFVASLLLLAAASRAQAPLAQWHHLDPSADKVMGISTDRAYALLRTLPARPAPRPIIVAVIDGGVDTAHIDLRRVLWHNPGEVPANGLDDDHNGYADDVYGWNFTGGADGRNLFHNPKEETRLYARLRPLYEGLTLTTVPTARRAEFQLYERVKKYYTTKRAAAEADYQQGAQGQFSTAHPRRPQADYSGLGRASAPAGQPAAGRFCYPLSHGRHREPVRGRAADQRRASRQNPPRCPSLKRCRALTCKRPAPLLSCTAVAVAT